MRISVLGAVVHDEIITHLGERKESYGGITYNVAAFSSIISDDTVIVPVSNVAEDHFEHVISLMSRYPEVELGELHSSPPVHIFTPYRDSSSAGISSNLAAPDSASRYHV